jgi:hypothetical protein
MYAGLRVCMMIISWTKSHREYLFGYCTDSLLFVERKERMTTTFHKQEAASCCEYVSPQSAWKTTAPRHQVHAIIATAKRR